MTPNLSPTGSCYTHCIHPSRRCSKKATESVHQPWVMSVYPPVAGRSEVERRVLSPIIIRTFKYYCINEHVIFSIRYNKYFKHSVILMFLMLFLKQKRYQLPLDPSPSCTLGTHGQAAATRRRQSTRSKGRSSGRRKTWVAWFLLAPC